jgi:ribosomal-protein-alanine N-acetyltransferase
LLVGEVEGRVVGFAVGKVAAVGKETIAELESVAVDPGERRKGVGRALCRTVMAWCEGMGAGRIELEVRAGSVAIALYQGLGFAKTGRRRGYYREPAEDAVLMQIESGR